MALIKCSKCAAEISDNAARCPNCGAPVVAHKWMCSKCGNMITEEPCPYCSNTKNTKTDINVENDISSPPKRTHKKGLICGTILILCIATFIIVRYNDNAFVGEYIRYENGFNPVEKIILSRYDFKEYRYEGTSYYFRDWVEKTGSSYNSLEFKGNFIILYSGSNANMYFYNKKKDSLIKIKTGEIFEKSRK